MTLRPPATRIAPLTPLARLVLLTLALALILPLVLAGGALSAQTRDEPVAAFTFLAGAVKYKPAYSTAWNIAHLYGSLSPGDELKLASKASCIISFDYFRVQVNGPAQARVGKNGLVRVSGSPKAVRRIDSGVFLAQAPKPVMQHIGGQGYRMMLIGPTSSPTHVILSTTPGFRWHLSEPRESTTVILMDEKGRTLWTRPAGGESLAYPADQAPLQPGGAYQWYALAGPAVTDMDIPGYFKVLGAAPAAEVKAMQAKARELLKKHPQDAAPLQFLLARMAELDLAQDAYQVGLELQRKFPKIDISLLMKDLKGELGL